MNPTLIAQLIAVLIVFAISGWIIKKFAPAAQRCGKNPPTWIFLGSLTFFGTFIVITIGAFLGSVYALQAIKGLDKSTEGLVILMLGYSVFLGLTGGLFATRKLLAKLTGGSCCQTPPPAGDLVDKQ